MKIQLTNKTHWRDDHIRAFIARGMRAERPDLCKRKAYTMHVVISYRRGDGASSSGCAYLRSHWMTVRLPHVNPDRVDFAHVIAHELAHTRGLTHDRMNSCATYGRVGRWREIYAWGDTLPLETKAKTVKMKPTADVKLKHCEKMLKAAMTREKRATTLRKKWQQKLKYYQKKAGAVGDSLALAA